jgi:hypothetical protein
MNLGLRVVKLVLLTPLENRIFICPRVRKVGAGDEDRTRNFQLGKLRPPPRRYNN